MTEERMPTMTPQRIPIRFAYKAPVFLLGLIGYLYAFWLIINYEKDTTTITNTAFAIMATLASLSFSFARVIESDELKDRLMFAGERFLHGGILVLVASLLKYLVITFLNWPPIANQPAVHVATQFTIGLLVAVIFTNGILFAHPGLRIVNDLLLMRMTRHRDWDDIV